MLLQGAILRGAGAVRETGDGFDKGDPMVVLWILMLLAVPLTVVLIEGGDPLAYLNVSAFILVFFLPFFASLAVWKWKELAAAWAAPFSGKTAKAGSAVKVWNFMEKLSYLSGLLGLVMGGVAVCANIGAWSGRDGAVWQAFAVVLIAPFYGLLFGIVARTMRQRCVKD
jgi:hypothetical protein